MQQHFKYALRAWSGPVLGQVIDQAGHFIWGFCIVLVASMMYRSLPDWLAAFCLPIFIVLPREIIDQWPINNIYDTILDLMFFGLGGFGCWLLNH
jgi:hypothetical protein